MSGGLALEELLPHRAPMLLLTRVLGPCEDGTFAAEVEVGEASPFYEAPAGVPAWVGVEYMAQAVAAYNGFEHRAAGGAARAGFLLGTREYLSSVPAFAAGSRLTVTVKKTIHAAGGVSSLECRILGEGRGELASAQLTVIEVEDIASALKGM